ncbi:MAG: sensor histidine kinase [Salibacteraceae bacterium]|nr:sensor histidine kinase [Salibacteraceae bacterium]
MKSIFSIILNLVVLLTLAPTVYASNSQDSLLAIFNQIQDTSKISIGIQLIPSFADTDMPQALDLANEMYAVAQISKDTRSIASCQNILGILYKKNREGDIALTFLNQAATNFNKIGALEAIVAVENNIGRLYYVDGNLINSLNHFFKADSISSMPDYSGKHLTTTAVNTAFTLAEVGLYDLSNDFYNKALSTLNFSSQECSIYAGLLFNSLEQNKLYSSNKYFKKLEAIGICTTSKDYIEIVLFMAYYQYLYGNKKEGNKGVFTAEKALIGSNKSQTVARQYLLLAKVFLAGNQHQKSLIYAQLANEILKENKNLYRQKQAINITLLASTKLNLPNAYSLALRLDSIDNAIIQETGLNILRNIKLQTAFEEVTLVKDQVTLENDEKTVEITARSKTEKIGIMLIFALFMLGAMLFMAIRQMKARQKELEEHKRLLKEKHEETKKSHKVNIDEKDKLLDLVFTKALDLVVLCKVEQDGQIIVKSINQALDLINFNFGLNLNKDHFIEKNLISIVTDFPLSDAESIEEKLSATTNVIDTKQAVTFEITFTVNAFSVNMEVTIEPIIRDDKSANHLLYTLKDISKRVKKERQNIQAILQAEDHERERIAKELHDGLGQNLTAAQLYLDGFLGDKEEEKYVGLMNARKFLNLGLDECRNLSHNLIPKSISDIELDETLEQLILDLNKLSKVQIEFNSNLSKIKIPKSIALNFYRIAQEAINNALKYSESTKISVQLLLFNEIITLSIEDNGKGFDKQKTLESKSFGLHSILNRGEYIGANVIIDSKLNEGTMISIAIKKQRLG